jgi:hypothetical protein
VTEWITTNSGIKDILFCVLLFCFVCVCHVSCVPDVAGFFALSVIDCPFGSHIMKWISCSSINLIERTIIYSIIYFHLSHCSGNQGLFDKELTAKLTGLKTSSSDAWYSSHPSYFTPPLYCLCHEAGAMFLGIFWQPLLFSIQYDMETLNRLKLTLHIF